MSHRSHKRSKKSRFKSLVYIFLSFVLSFVLFLLSVCLVLRLTVFSGDFMKSAMSGTGYYEFVSEEFSDGMIL